MDTRFITDNRFVRHFFPRSSPSIGPLTYEEHISQLNKNLERKQQNLRIGSIALHALTWPLLGIGAIAFCAVEIGVYPIAAPITVVACVIAACIAFFFGHRNLKSKAEDNRKNIAKSLLEQVIDKRGQLNTLSSQEEKQRKKLAKEIKEIEITWPLVPVNPQEGNESPLTFTETNSLLKTLAETSIKLEKITFRGIKDSSQLDLSVLKNLPLKEMHFIDSDIQDQHLEQLKSQKRLKKLSLKNNNFVTADGIKKLSHLGIEELDLSGCRLQPLKISAQAAIDDFRKKEFANVLNSIDDKSNTEKLKRAYEEINQKVSKEREKILDNAHKEKGLPIPELGVDEIASLLNFKRLKKLTLSHISDDGFCCLARLKKLETLSLTYSSGFTGNQLASMNKHRVLTSLSLGELPSFSERAFGSLIHLQALECINFLSPIHIRDKKVASSFREYYEAESYTASKDDKFSGVWLKQ